MFHKAAKSGKYCAFRAQCSLVWGVSPVREIGKGYNMSIKDNIDPGFRGIVYVERDEEVLCESITGFADIANGIPNTISTRFETASAGKAFVAAGILQLIEQGRLRFDSTLGELFDIDLHDIDPEVTVRQLLTHTSGVPDYFDESVMDEYEELWRDIPNYRIRRNDDLFALFIDKPMMYPRGERFQYNNSGYVLLASVIERVTGTPFDEYLAKNVFEPCGMSSTGYFPLDRLPAGCANSYILCPETGGFRTNIYSIEANGSGAGGAFVTVPDILLFWKGLLGGKLLSADTVSQMMSRQSGDGSDPVEGYYGYGLWIIDAPAGRDIAYFHGCDPGAGFLSEYDPNTGTISVLVSNYCDNVWAEMRKIRKAIY